MPPNKTGNGSTFITCSTKPNDRRVSQKGPSRNVIIIGSIPSGRTATVSPRTACATPAISSPAISHAILISVDSIRAVNFFRLQEHSKKSIVIITRGNRSAKGKMGIGFRPGGVPGRLVPVTIIVRCRKNAARNLMNSPQPTESLTGKTSRGFVWMVLQTVASKIFGFIGQMILARLLLPKDFGIMAMAYAAAAIPSMIRQTGVIQILVQKQSSFDRWVNAGFWMELALGTLAALLTVAIAPAACLFFHTNRLFGPLILIALLTVIGTFNTPPYARLMLQLRFRTIAIAGIAYNLAVVILSVALAFLGFGVYSFILPLPIVATARVIFYWRMAPVRIKMYLQLYRWRPMFLDSIFLMGSGLFATILGQADNVALGRFVTATEVGYYSVASNLSVQVLTTLSVNLSGVLFPTLSQLKDDPPRQTAAFFRAARLLALIGIPMCVLEAALANPIITFIYGPKYIFAISLLRLLALAAGINLLFGPLQNFLQSQGRFSILFKWTGFLVTVFVTMVFIAAWQGGALWVAWCVLAMAGIFQPIGIWLATRKRGGIWRDVAVIYLPPILISAMALFPFEFLFHVLPWIAQRWWAVTLVCTGTFLPFYITLMRLFRPSDFNSIREHIQHILHHATGKADIII